LRAPPLPRLHTRLARTPIPVSQCHQQLRYCRIQRTARELDATNAPLKKRVTAIVDEFTYQHKDTVYTIGYGLAGAFWDHPGVRL